MNCLTHDQRYHITDLCNELFHTHTLQKVVEEDPYKTIKHDRNTPPNEREYAFDIARSLLTSE